MAIFGYLVLWFLGCLGAFLLGLFGHYSQAFLSATPTKMVDGYRWRDHALNNALNSNYTWWGDYDEDGWWEFYSLKNFLAFTVPPTAFAFVIGMVFWSDRATIVVDVCRRVAAIGMKPLFCGG